MPAPDLSAAPTAALVGMLKTCGYDVPDGLPEAIVRRAPEAIPPLSAIVRDEASWNSKEPRAFMAPVHALHLLGAIGDPSVAPLLVDLVKTRDLGDLLHETMPSILAALGPGAAAALVAAAEDRSLDVYQRHAFALALYTIAARHPEVRPEAVALFTRLLRDDDGELVSFAVDEAALMDDAGVQAAVDAAFDEDRVFTMIIARSDLDSLRAEPRWSIPRTIEEPIEFFRSRRLAAMKQNWHDWQRREAEKVRASAKKAHVGRNDPCPCGSGKKYKKCCLG